MSRRLGKRVNSSDAQPRLRDDNIQVSGVRASPVDAIASAATGEVVVRPPRPRPERVRDVLLADRMQDPVAGRTPREGLQRRAETIEYVAHLVLGPGAADIGTMADRAPAQEPSVLRQQDPPLVGSLGRQLVIVGVVAVARIDAEQPQAAGRRAEAHVEQEAGRRGRRCRRPAYGEDVRHVAGPGPVRRRSRFPVDGEEPTSVSGMPTDSTR